MLCRPPTHWELQPTSWMLTADISLKLRLQYGKQEWKKGAKDGGWKKKGWQMWGIQKVFPSKKKKERKRPLSARLPIQHEMVQVQKYVLMPRNVPSVTCADMSSPASTRKKKWLRFLEINDTVAFCHNLVTKTGARKLVKKCCVFWCVET